MIRPATIEDLPGITIIYNDAIINTTATFDTETKTVGMMEPWFEKHDKKYCLFVFESEGKIAGWGSLSRWSDRCAYDDTAELSVYVDLQFRRRGIAKKLMEKVIAEGAANGVHTIISRITTENEISIRLHEQFDFLHVGILREVGRKFNKLLDVAMMQKMLVRN